MFNTFQRHGGLKIQRALTERSPHAGLPHVLEQGSAIYGPWAKSGQIPVFVNKVLLEHTPIRLWNVYSCFQATMAELSSCDHRTLKAKNLYPLTLQKKFATPLLEDIGCFSDCSAPAPPSYN